MAVLTADATVLSADSHVLEPADLWTNYIDPAFADRAPRVVNRLERKNGETIDGEFLVCEGVAPQRVAGFAAADVDDPKWRTEANERGFEQLLSGGWDPEQRLKDQEIDGVTIEVIYPSMAMPMFGLPDTGLQQAIFSGYNRWIADYVSYAPDRLIGVGLISTDDLDQGIGEMERCRELGLRGAMICLEPAEGTTYAEPEWNPLWAAATALEMPISLHIVTGRGGTGLERTPFLMAYMGQYLPIQLSMTAMLVGGVFARHPDLRVVSVENDIGWVPHYLQKLEHGFEQFRYMVEYDSPASPLEYFAENFYLTFQDDPIGVQHLDTIGVDHVMWASDYPHGDSTWPYSREAIERNFAGVAPDVVAKVTEGNMRRLYGL